MFNPMRRFKQQLSTAECVQTLKNEPRGVLSLICSNGYPYGLPIDHLYCAETNRLYFHGAGVGTKIEAISHCDKASYCVMDSGFRRDGEWALNIKSVIVFGRIQAVTDIEKTQWICEQLARKFTDDEDYIAHELTNALPRVLCLELIPEHMSGKLVNEA